MINDLDRMTELAMTGCTQIRGKLIEVSRFALMIGSEKSPATQLKISKMVLEATIAGIEKRNLKPTVPCT